MTDDGVVWRAWGDEALAEARQAGRPVLIDVRVAGSDACRRMAQTHYGPGPVADRINRAFVPIRIDADERPDLARRYRAALTAWEIAGDYPLTLFCTPGGEPFFGEAGFHDPAESGRTPFPAVLDEMARTFAERGDELAREAAFLTKRLFFVESFMMDGAPVTPALIGAIADADDRASPRPAFPDRLPRLDLLLDLGARGSPARALGAALPALDEALAAPAAAESESGTALLLKTAAHAWLTTGRPEYEAAARTLLARALGTPAAFVDAGALGLSAAIEAARALGDRATLSVAIQRLDRMTATAWRDGAALSHAVAGGAASRGMLDDYAAFANACLDAYAAGGAARHYELAVQVADAMLRQLYHTAFKGFMDSHAGWSGAGVLSILCKPFADGRVPGGNPLATIALLRLFQLNGDTMYRSRAQATLSLAVRAVDRFGTRAGTYGLAAGWLMRPPLLVVVLGGDDAADRLEAAALRPFAVNKTVLRPAGREALPTLVAQRLAQAGAQPGAESCAMVFRNGAFLPPITDPAALAARIGETLSLGV